MEAFNLGKRTGAAETVAQAAEQGIHVQLNLDPVLLDIGPDEDALFGS
jgi:hypothetical protein